MAENWRAGDLCSWRYPHKKQWQRSHVLGVMADKDGSVKVLDKRSGFPAYVPDDPEYIRKREKC